MTAGPWTNRANTCFTQNGADDIDDIEDIGNIDDIEEIDDIDDIEEIDDLDEQLEGGHHHGDVVQHGGEVPGRGREEAGTAQS